MVYDQGHNLGFSFILLLCLLFPK